LEATCHLYLHGRRLSQARNQRESGAYGVISREIELFTTTTVRTSDTTQEITNLFSEFINMCLPLALFLPKYVFEGTEIRISHCKYIQITILVI
jgi:hypothetical protein